MHRTSPLSACGYALLGWRPCKSDRMVRAKPPKHRATPTRCFPVYRARSNRHDSTITANGRGTGRERGGGIAAERTTTRRVNFRNVHDDYRGRYQVRVYLARKKYSRREDIRGYPQNNRESETSLWLGALLVRYIYGTRYIYAIMCPAMVYSGSVRSSALPAYRRPANGRKQETAPIIIVFSY